MIYRRPIRDVVEERHGRTCGVHVLVMYIIALTAVLAMSLACLGATDAGYFVFEQKVEVPTEQDSAEFLSDIMVDYETTYGWQRMCSSALATYRNENAVPQAIKSSGCFDLANTVQMEQLKVTLAAGSSMTADTGLAVALGHAVSATVAATHILFFVCLYFNIDPVPVRGYLYMRGLGLMSALSSFYLLFTCVVSFFFGVKGSLDVHVSSSGGLRPSWAYVLTVINVTLMVVVGMLACQDDEVDAAIATPQYTSSSRDEDTVKRASGKLLHLRSRSSDTLCEGFASISATAPTALAPKSTVIGSGGITTRGGGGAHPPPASVALANHGGGAGSSSMRMSAAASSAAAHAAASASGRHGPSPVPSSSVMSSWTGRVSGFSPRRRGDEEEGGLRGADGECSDDPDSGRALDAALAAGGGDGGGRGGSTADKGTTAAGDAQGVELVHGIDAGVAKRDTNDDDVTTREINRDLEAGVVGEGIYTSSPRAAAPAPREDGTLCRPPRHDRVDDVVVGVRSEQSEDGSSPLSAVATAPATANPASSSAFGGGDAQAEGSTESRPPLSDALTRFSTARTVMSDAIGEGASDEEGDHSRESDGGERNGGEFTAPPTLRHPQGEDV